MYICFEVTNLTQFNSTLKIFAKEVPFLQAVDEKQDWFVREIYGDKQQWYRPPLKRAY